MPIVESKPVATSIRVDHEHTLEMRADMASKTAEVENVTTGEMYTSGGGDSDFSTAEVTITNNESAAVTLYIPNADELSGTPFSPSCVSDAYIPGNETIIIKAVLYKGRVMTAMAPNIEIAGNATVENSMIIITGDCTITLSSIS